MDRERCTGARGHVGVAPAPLPAESIHMWEMPSGLPVDPIRDLEGWSDRAIDGTRPY